MDQIILSILTPAVPSRFEQLQKLSKFLESQIGTRQVEHLILMDNKRRTVGEKRDALLRAARGRYVAFVDDDDWVSADYVSMLVAAASTEPYPHVITFRQRATVNDQEGDIIFRLGNPNEPFNPAGTTLRNAWHVCAWSRSLAIQSSFPASNYGEDWAFAAPLCALDKLQEVHISKTLHFYRHSDKTTEAPLPR